MSADTYRNEEINISHTRLGDVLTDWLCFKKQSVKASSYARYHNIIWNHIYLYFGNVYTHKITEDMINSFIMGILNCSKPETGRGLSVKCIKEILFILKNALHHANITIDVRLNLPKEKRKPVRVLTANEQAILEKYLLDDINGSKLGVLLCLYTGLRLGEICALTWKDISPDNAVLSVSRTLQRVQVFDAGLPEKTKLLLTEPKSDCSVRFIPIPDCITDVLKQLRPENPDCYVLTGENSRFTEPRTYQNHFKLYIAECGLRDVNFHVTRHTFATRCVELGFDIKSLSEILGHANVNITLERYVHPSFDLKRCNMNRLKLMG